MNKISEHSKGIIMNFENMPAFANDTAREMFCLKKASIIILKLEGFNKQFRRQMGIEHGADDSQDVIWACMTYCEPYVWNNDW